MIDTLVNLSVALIIGDWVAYRLAKRDLRRKDWRYILPGGGYVALWRSVREGYR